MAISKVIVIDPHGEEKFNEHLSTADREIAIGEHNSDAQAHPAIQEELADKIDDIKVGGESVVEEVDGKKVVNFRKDQFGKVDGIAVNGTSVVLDEHGIANIQVPTTVAQLGDASDYAKAADVTSLQEQVTTDISDLQAQIDAMVADKATVSLTASPTTIYTGEQTAIALTAKITGATASSITIKKGNTVLASDTNKTQLAANDSVSANASYSAEFVVNGKTKTASASVSAVGKIYYGAGLAEAAATTLAPKRTSPAGTYNVTVSTTGHYIYFVVPSNMSINSATLSGFDFPLDAPTTTTRDGAAYKVYKSSNALDADTYDIVIK